MPLQKSFQARREEFILGTSKARFKEAPVKMRDLNCQEVDRADPITPAAEPSDGAARSLKNCGNYTTMIKKREVPIPLAARIVKLTLYVAQGKWLH